MKKPKTTAKKPSGRPPRYGPELEKLNGSVPVTPDKLARSLWPSQPAPDRQKQKTR